MALQAPPAQLVSQISLYLGPTFWSRWGGAIVGGWQAVPNAVPTSWYRTAESNAAVGGHPRSQHLWGLAIDFAIPGVGASHRTSADAIRLAQAMEANGLVPVIESDHVHVQTFPAGVV